MSESLGPLNLSDANLAGFDAVEPGRYNAVVHAITTDAVKNATGEGKMPAGTPMIKVQFRLTDEGVDNRRVFASYVIPPKDYDEKKAAVMKGMIARFFIALGVKEETVLSAKFNPDFDDFIDKPCVVVVGKEPKKDQSGNIVDGEFNNPVKGVKAAGDVGAASSALL